MENQIIQLLLNTWTSQNNAVTDFLTKYSDEAYLNEVAFKRNSAAYLFGHLIATNDSLFPLFGIGQRQFPKLEEAFLKAPYDKAAEYPTVSELRDYWNTVNEALTNHFSKMTAKEWLERHTAVSEEDFAINPQRNKLNVLIGRTNHQSYHLGQMRLLNT